MQNDFKHKVVVVTGATRGIGRALCWRFAKAGARIVMIGLDSEQLSALQNQVERSGTEVMSIECDITDYDKCRSAMQDVVAQFGGIDVLINNAGISHRSRFDQTEMVVFRRIMEVNYFGAIHCTKAALDSLVQRKGMIITLSSSAGFAPMIGRVAYSASKHALHGLFESLRLELMEKGVHVMMACPGTTATDLRKNAMAGDGSAVSIPVESTHKMSTPQEVAEAIYRGAEKNRRIVIHSRMSKLSWFYWKFFPALYEYKLYKQLGPEFGLL